MFSMSSVEGSMDKQCRDVKDRSLSVLTSRLFGMAGILMKY